MSAVSPLDVRIVADEQPLTAQRKYDLVCESTGSRPPAKLTWWKNNSRLERTKDSVSASIVVLRADMNAWMVYGFYGRLDE